MYKILLVEDDENSYDMLTGRLEHTGYEVALATTGEEALDMVGAEDYDLILMDIRLPDLDGYEVTRRIRERSGGNVPIIALTAYALVEDPEKALAAGCDDHHAKPIHFKKLLEQMNDLLDGADHSIS